MYGIPIGWGGHSWPLGSCYHGALCVLLSCGVKVGEVMNIFGTFVPAFNLC